MRPSILILFILLAPVCTQESSLEFVQVIFRHGERNPDGIGHSMELPDLWKEYEGRLGYLTAEGRRQAYTLGKLFHNRYSTFLNRTYNESEFFMHSGDDNRTTGTALTFLAGLFPVENPKNNWNPKILWRPIPIHTDSRLEDIALGEVYQKCHALRAEFTASDAYVKLWDQSRPARIILEEKLGTKIDNFGTYIGISAGLAAMRILNGPDYFPEWLTPELQDEIQENAFFDELLLGNPDLLKATAGPLIDEFLTRISNFLTKRSLHKFVAYSDHGPSIVAIINALELTVERIVPEGPYCDYVIFELHRTNNSYFLKIYARDQDTGQPIGVKLKNCQNHCPLEIFTQLAEPFRITFNEFYRLCANGSVDEKSIYYTTVGLITLSVILGAALILLSINYQRLRLEKKKCEIHEPR